jgi:hypothetical protein
MLAFLLSSHDAYVPTPPASLATPPLEGASDTLASYGNPTCPSAAEGPTGVLHNHVSKAGGTEMYHVFGRAFGYDKVQIRQEVLRGDEPDLVAQRPSASVLYDDCNPYMRTSPEVASRFFSIATVRRPCDYYTSLWKFASDRPLSVGHPIGDSPFLGQSPPYTSAADVARFRGFMREVFNRTGLADNYALRLGNGSQVHCYARTDRLLDDVQSCFDHFTTRCGGSIPHPLWKRDAESALQARGVSNAGKSGGGGSSCHRYFNQAEQDAMMAREDARLAELGFGRTLRQLGIDRCCSPPGDEPRSESVERAHGNGSPVQQRVKPGAVPPTVFLQSILPCAGYS